MKEVYIAGQGVGPDHSCFIIAEAGVNHNGSLEVARRMVEVARTAGVNAIKFQSFKAERMVTMDAPKAPYQSGSESDGGSQLEMLRRLELTPDAHRALMRECQEKGILFISSPFDEQSADLLADLGVEAFKVPSGEITNLPFLRYLAKKSKPLLLSTGMSYLGEVETAVQTLEEAGNHDLVLLHCVSSYPALPAEINLKAMRTMARAFGVPAGYSDHTMGIEVALAAVALGACVLEKHFTLNRGLPGPDHRASLEPEELAALVRGVRAVEAAIGHGRKEPAFSEATTRAVARKSLVAARDIAAGTILTEELIAIKRPGTGLAPALLSQLAGRRVKHDISRDALLSLEMLA